MFLTLLLMLGFIPAIGLGTVSAAAAPIIESPQVWLHTLHPWLRFLAGDMTTIDNQAAYDDFAAFLTDTSGWEYVAENIDVIQFFGCTTVPAIMSDELVSRFCNMVKGVNAKRAALGKGRLQIAFEMGGILAYQGAGAKGSYEEAYYWFEQEALTSAIPRMKAQGVYADYINLDGAISRATGNQNAASGQNPSPGCPVMTLEQAVSEVMHLMQIYQGYYADVGHEVKFNYLFNFPNHGWKGARAVTYNGSGYSDAYPDMLALDSAAKATGAPLVGFVLDAPYNYRDMAGIDLLGRCLDFEKEARVLGYVAGIVFNADVEKTGGDRSANFYGQSLEFIEAYESRGGKPDIYIAESWYTTAPATHLPENTPYTLTNLAKAFIDHVKFDAPVLSALGCDVTRTNGFWKRLANILTLSLACRDYQRVEIVCARTDVTVEYYVGGKDLAPTAIADGDWKPYTGPFSIHPGFFFGLICPKTVYARLSDGVNPPVYTSK
jgi:hypothetical protein